MLTSSELISNASRRQGVGFNLAYQFISIRNRVYTFSPQLITPGFFSTLFHIALHFIVPAILVSLFYRNGWKIAYLALIGTMLVDIDHLLADPIYDANRCSIGFHPLHQYGMIVLYVLLSAVPKTRLIGLGLLIHMALDALDCLY